MGQSPDDVTVTVTFTCEVCGTVNVVALPRTLDPAPPERPCQGKRCRAVYRIYTSGPPMVIRK